MGWPTGPWSASEGDPFSISGASRRPGTSPVSVANGEDATRSNDGEGSLGNSVGKQASGDREDGNRRAPE